MDCSPLGSSVYGIVQARILECIAISCYKGYSLITLSQTSVGQVREDELEQTLNNLFCFVFSMLMLTIYLIYEVTDVQRN